MMRVLTCVVQEHDLRLVLLAAVMCVSGAFIGFHLFSRARATEGSTRYGWLFLAGVATGSAIWTTHFIAMLAFQPTLPSTFETSLTVVSLFIAIGACTLGFALASVREVPLSAELGGMLIGLGIAAMHYSGMSAYRTSGRLDWDMTLVGASIVIGAVLGALALNRAVRSAEGPWKYGAVAIMTAAICGMHFTGMGAVSVVSDPEYIMPANSVSSGVLGLTIAAICTLVVGTGFSSYLIDSRSRSEAASHIHHLAFHDSLTGLPNRVSFNERLDAELAHPRGDRDALAVLCMDLDRFKEINDMFGHGAGDRILIEVTQRMNACLRKGEFLARLGGDEFVAIQTSSQQPRDAGDLAERLTRAFGQPFVINGTPMQLDISIGIAISATDGNDREQLLSNADVAMYRAKKSGQGSICFFESAMDDAIRQRRALSHELKTAIERNELELYYQVQKTVQTSEICGFEALLRWHHRTRGTVSPAEFIPLAEETGLIIPIGEWVLRTACRDAATWDRPYKVAVNLSPVQFTHANLPQLVHQILLETGLPPSRLELEITESTLIGDLERTLHILRQLKALGVTVAMDDFGTGYSSLSTLQTFPFDKIKLDRSFVDKVKTQDQAAAIVRAVLSLGKSLTIPVLAEGVETEAHLAFLVVEECDEMQGFLLGRPAPLSVIRPLVNDGGEAPVSTEQPHKRAVNA